LRFSDLDTPFPASLIVAYPVSGTWVHVAGRGWHGVPAVEGEGPALLIPLLRPANWEIEVDLDYGTPGGITDEGIFVFGYCTSSNHVGAYGQIEDLNVAATSLTERLYTNDGAPGGYTQRYAGAALAGAAVRTYSFRCMNGCVGVWDDVDNLWHDYEGKQCAEDEGAWTAVYAFLQFPYFPYANAGVFWTIYLRRLQIIYSM
jgi:hypothetical protein